MTWQIREGDVLERLAEIPDGSIHCCVTSPPYWGLRDYGVDGQLGLEKTPDEFVAKMVEVFCEVKRVLRDDGTCWVNLGDSYATSGGGSHKDWHKNKGISNSSVRAGNDYTERNDGLKPKNLCGIPWRVAFALQADGWYLRSDIIWHKPNPMPESVTDRPTKAHEYIFLLSKSAKYFYDADAIREEPTGRTDPIRSFGKPKYADGTIGQGDGYAIDGMKGRNKRSVWTVATAPYSEAHFATFPPKLIEPCILAGCPPYGTVLDPFSGSGTTGMVALRHDRNYIGIELNPEYAEMSRRRIFDDAPLLNPAEAER